MYEAVIFLSLFLFTRPFLLLWCSLGIVLPILSSERAAAQSRNGLFALQLPGRSRCPQLVCWRGRYVHAGDMRHVFVIENSSLVVPFPAV